MKHEYHLSPLHRLEYDAANGTFRCNGSVVPVYFDEKGGLIRIGQYSKRALAIIKELEGVPSRARVHYLDDNPQNLKRSNLIFGNPGQHAYPILEQRIGELEQQVAQLTDTVGKLSKLLLE